AANIRISRCLPAILDHKYYPTSCRPRAVSTSCHPQAKLSPTTVPTTVTYELLATSCCPQICTCKKKIHQACNNRGLKLQ
ncbi:18788_t:CDS:1, partial [Gigaspora rosea]